jgi:2-polyprenyl-6-hydroxyphenyl methylase/3-demethylubiquinone-9 3-methyltransferase
VSDAMLSHPIIRRVDESLRDAISYHDEIARGWDDRYRKRSFRSRIAVLEQCLREQRLNGANWLDAGCGSGTISRWLAQQGCTVHGVDAAPEMIRAAMALASDGRPGHLSFSLIDTIAHLPLNSRSADGVLLVSVPNRESLVRRLQIVAHRICGRTGRLRFLDYSLHEYTIEDFQGLLVSAGFTVEQVLPFGSPLPERIQRIRFGGSLLMYMARKAA